MQGVSPNTIYAFAALACAAAGAVSDVRCQRISHWITIPGMVAGLLVHLAVGGWRAMLSAALAGTLAGGMFLLVYLAGGMSAGDVRLMAAVCCLAGLSAIAQILVGAAFAGGLAVLFVVAYRRGAQHELANVVGLVAHHGARRRPYPELSAGPPRAPHMPYALAIAAGAACFVCNVFAR